jgi:hypothetical protein
MNHCLLDVKQQSVNYELLFVVCIRITAYDYPFGIFKLFPFDVKQQPVNHPSGNDI